MGYDVNITRAPNWSENAGYEISADEWRTVVGLDPELEMRGVADAGSVRYENALLAVWTAHPDHHDVWVDYSRGNLVVKNPDLDILRKLCAPAAELGARFKVMTARSTRQTVESLWMMITSPVPTKRDGTAP